MQEEVIVCIQYIGKNVAQWPKYTYQGNPC